MLRIGVLKVLKRCSHCRTKKVKSEFYHRSSKKDGLDYYCKSCRDKYTVGNITTNSGVCLKDGCEKPHYAKLMCKNHYHQYRYHIKMGTNKEKVGRER